MQALQHMRFRVYRDPGSLWPFGGPVSLGAKLASPTTQISSAWEAELFLHDGDSYRHAMM